MKFKTKAIKALQEELKRAEENEKHWKELWMEDPRSERSERFYNESRTEVNTWLNAIDLVARIKE